MICLNRYVSKNHDAENGKIVFAGSSLMEEFPLEQLFLDKEIIVYNRGISGATSKDYLEIFDRLILSIQPVHLLINIGSNDLADECFEDSHLLDSYRQIFSKLKKSLPQCAVTFIKFYPVNTGIMQDVSKKQGEQWLLQASKYRINSRVIEASEKISKLADSNGYETIEVNNLLIDETKQLDALNTKDGINLTEAAYRKIFPLIYQHVDLVRKVNKEASDGKK